MESSAFDIIPWIAGIIVWAMVIGFFSLPGFLSVRWVLRKFVNTSREKEILVISGILGVGLGVWLVLYFLPALYLGLSL